MPYRYFTTIDPFAKPKTYYFEGNSPVDFDRMADALMGRSPFSEKDGYYVADLNLAGVDPKDVEVELVEDHRTTVFKVTTPKATHKMSLGGRLYDTSKEINVELKHGLLTVKVPMRNNSRKLEIKQ
jgi:HSP20 family molecular chaperone IbpA